MDASLAQGCADLIDAGLVPVGTDPARFTDLVVSHARGLDGVEQFSGLRTLSLIGCDIPDYGPLRQLDRLEVLVVEFANLADLAWATGLPLTVVVLRGTHVTDAAPLCAIDSLQSVELRGTPLRPGSRADLAATLGGRSALTLDDEEAWLLCCDIHRAGVPAAVYRSARGLRAAWTGLAMTAVPEADHPVVTPAEVAASLVAGRGLRDIIPSVSARP